MVKEVELPIYPILAFKVGLRQGAKRKGHRDLRVLVGDRDPMSIIRCLRPALCSLLLAPCCAQFVLLWTNFEGVNSCA